MSQAQAQLELISLVEIQEQMLDIHIQELLRLPQQMEQYHFKEFGMEPHQHFLLVHIHL